MRLVLTKQCIPCQKRIGYPLKGLQLFDKMENSHCQSQEEEPLEQKDKGEMIRLEQTETLCQFTIGSLTNHDEKNEERRRLNAGGLEQERRLRRKNTTGLQLVE